MIMRNVGRMNKIQNYILNNKHFATSVIEDFNEESLLEIHGENIKRHII